MDHCDKIREFIPLLIDKSLDQTKRAIVQKHLQKCTDCRQYFQEMKTITKELSQQDFGIDKEYSNQLIADINAKIDKKESKKFTSKLVTAISTAVLIITILITGFNFQSSQTINFSQIDMDDRYLDAYLELASSKGYGFEEIEYYLLSDELDIDVSDIAYSFIEVRGTESFEDIIALTGNLSESDYSDLIASSK